MSLTALKPLRKKIDRLDNHILALLNERLRVVKLIGKLKGQFTLPFYDPTREKIIVARLRRRNAGPLTDEALRRIFVELFSAARSLVRQLRVAYLGPQGTFTEQAARQHFGSAPEFVPMSSIAEIFEEVEDGRVDYGVTPVENSNEGIVTHTLDALLRANLHVVAEEQMRVRLALLSRSRRIQDIREIFSHTHGLALASAWISKHAPSARLREVASTGAAAQMARRQSRAAAVASELAAGTYGLNVLATGIDSMRQNLTRFLVLGKSISPRSGDDKTSIAFSLKDRVGALNRVLRCFAKHRINLTRIESRPARAGRRNGLPRRRSSRSPFEYVFFVDFLGHLEDPPVRNAIAEVRAECEELRIFGSFPCSRAM